jgi:hypothetical protein
LLYSFVFNIIALFQKGRLRVFSIFGEITKEERQIFGNIKMGFLRFFFFFLNLNSKCFVFLSITFVLSHENNQE